MGATSRCHPLRDSRAVGPQIGLDAAPAPLKPLPKPHGSRHPHGFEPVLRQTLERHSVVVGVHEPRLPGDIARCFGDDASRTRVNLTDRLPTVQGAPPDSRGSEHSPHRSRAAAAHLTGYEDSTRRMPLPRTPTVIRPGGFAPCIAAAHPSWAPAAFEPLRPRCYARH